MKNKEKIYSRYYSFHTSYFGEITIEKIKKQFSVWKYYFGNFLPKDKHARIIDVGGGEGGFIYWLQKIGYINAFAIDISEEQINIGKNLGIDNIILANVFEFLRNKKEVYDLIFARDFLEHFEKDEIINILEFFYISLKKNGKLVISVPNAEGPFGSHYRYGDFTHEIIFTERSLNQIMKLVGFVKILCFPTPPPTNGFFAIIRFFLWKLIDYCLHFYSLIETGISKGIFTRNIISMAIKR